MVRLNNCPTCPTLMALGEDVTDVSGSFGWYGGGSDWGSWVRDLISGLFRTVETVAVNQAPPIRYEVGPGGTRVYGDPFSGAGGGYVRTGAPAPGTTPGERVASGLGSTALIVIGGIVIVALLVRNKGD